VQPSMVNSQTRQSTVLKTADSQAETVSVKHTSSSTSKSDTSQRQSDVRSRDIDMKVDASSSVKVQAPVSQRTYSTAVLSHKSDLPTTLRGSGQGTNY